MQRILASKQVAAIKARPPGPYGELERQLQALRLLVLQLAGMVTRRLDDVEAGIAHTFEECKTRCDQQEQRIRELEARVRGMGGAR